MTTPYSNPHITPLVTTKAIHANIDALIAKRDDSLQRLAAAGITNDVERILTDFLYRLFEPQIHALAQRVEVAEYWETKVKETNP